MQKLQDKPEVERLGRVYKAYREDSRVLERWNPRNKGNQIAVTDRRAILHSLLAANGFFPLSGRRILDVGCGSGRELAHFLEWGAQADNLFGIDLQADLIKEASASFAGICFRQGNAEQLEFADDSFDLVLLFTVFTSILDETMASHVAAEIRRVLKPSGAVVWYDFRYDNPRNVNVRGVGRKRIRGLFPGFSLRLSTTTLIPPLSRRLGRTTSVLYRVLTMIPFFRTHYVGLLLKSAE